MGLGCGHSVCQLCSRRAQSCPKCRQIFTAPTVNYDLLGVLEQYLKLKAENDANTQLSAQAVNDLRRMQEERNNAHLLLVEAERKQLLDEQKAHEARDVERAIAQSLLDEEKRKNHENERELLGAYNLHQNQQRDMEEKFVQLAILRSREEKLVNESRQNADLQKSITELAAAQLGKAINWKTVFIRGLPAGMSEDQFELMSLAIIDDLTEKITIKIHQPQSKGECLITFEYDESASKFIEMYNKQKFMDTEKVMKIEYGKFTVKNDNLTSSNNQPQSTNVQTIDKTKLFITGIPSWVSVDDIHKWIFEFNPNLQNGKSGISLRKSGDKQTCLASFTNDNDPTKIITKFHNQLYPGSDHELAIYHHRPKPQNRTQQNDIQKRPNETPKTNDEVDLFILGLPPKVTETDVTVMIFRNSPNLLTHSISLKPVGSVQSCKATVKSRTFATLLMSEWNGKNYPGSSSFIKIDFFKPPNRPRDPSRGRATQQLSRPVPRLTPSPTSPTYPPRQHRQDNFQPPQMFYAQQQYQQVLAPNHFAERVETHQFAPTFNSGLPTPQQLHKVLVSGLPAETQIDDLVTAFHPICKIALDFELNPRIEIYRDTEGRFLGIASVAFQTSDAAQKIVHLFNNTQFGSTNNVTNRTEREHMPEFVKLQAGKQAGGSVDILFYLTLSLRVAAMLNIGFVIIEQRRARRREWTDRAEKERKQGFEQEKIQQWYLEEVYKEIARKNQQKLREKQNKQLDAIKNPLLALHNLKALNLGGKREPENNTNTKDEKVTKIRQTHAARSKDESTQSSNKTQTKKSTVAKGSGAPRLEKTASMQSVLSPIRTAPTMTVEVTQEMPEASNND
ncbi:unnamed protein product, partial [Mesorhabditis belari]|uniref:RRM domain-containing protein n=1 Tax=Mesorhabditis belari TaxID=2138241 RepID=A0AAF3J941_9BILA